MPAVGSECVDRLCPIRPAALQSIHAYHQHVDRQCQGSQISFTIYAQLYIHGTNMHAQRIRILRYFAMCANAQHALLMGSTVTSDAWHTFHSLQMRSTAY